VNYETITTYHGDCLAVLPTLPAGSVHLCVTSPPYFGLRAYSDDPREIGREPTPDLYIANLVAVFREVRRVLRDDGVLVLNLGDSYTGSSAGQVSARQASRTSEKLSAEHNEALGARIGVPDGLKPKDKLLIPHRVALALQSDGWYLRQDMPWLKRNAMPESVTDRPSVAHEYVFILAKSERYWWDAEAVRVAALLTGGGTIPTPDKAARSGITNNGTGATTLRSKDLPAGRNYRSADLWFASLDAEIAYHRARLGELERIRERGGLLTDEDGEPLALPVNPRPYKEAHFAVFPPALVEPFIKAACPRQCCPTCGAGWVRVVEQVGTVQDRWSATNGHAELGGTHTERTHRRVMATTGFRPACACPPAEPVPGVVLDPFGGSGTVGQVAIANGRRAVLIDLNAAYRPLQDKRTDGVQVTLPLEAA
jgi:DNA modification methylase